MTKHSPDATPERQSPLSDKVRRILHSLAKSSFTDVRFEATANPEDDLMVSDQAVEKALREWRERGLYLPGDLFSDPAWGMLLELLHAEIEQRCISLASLYKASTVSVASAARWLKALEKQGLAVRRPDAHIRDNRFVELTPKASISLRRYFRDVVEPQI